MMSRRSLLLGSSILALFASALPLTQVATVATNPSHASQDSSLSTTSASHIFRRDPDPNKNAFITPSPYGIPNDFSDDQTYETGSQIIEVEWISEWQAVDLQICQPTTGATYGCYELIRGTLSGGFHWTVANLTDHIYGFQSPPIPDVYYFQLSETDTVNPNIKSHYFNIKKGANDTTSNDTTGGSDPSSTAISNQTTAATGSPSTTASNAITTPSTSTDLAQSSNHSGFSSLSTPGQVAIYAVSAAVGAGLCGAAIFWLVLRQRRKRQAAKLARIKITDSTSTLVPPIPLQEMHSDTFVHETGKALPHEISSKEVPMELPAEVPGLAISRYDDEDMDSLGSEWNAESRGSDRVQPRDGIS